MVQDWDNTEVVYSTKWLWETGRLIDDIGGCCMPVNPVMNPFPAGIERGDIGLFNMRGAILIFVM